MNRKNVIKKILDAANRNMFPNAEFEEDFKKGLFSDDAFLERKYRIRIAREDDIEILNHLEDVCWTEGTRTEEKEILQRLTDTACLNLVIEYEDKVVGVIYTQRILAENMKRVNSLQLEKYRTNSGNCIQAIALNILPEYQNLGLGFDLLEFALVYFSLDETVKTVCAVTRCRDYIKSDFASQTEYMKNIFHDGVFDDPILKFHQLHGAKILGLIPNYRPMDTDNQGYGVLVQYQIKERPWIYDIPCVGKIQKEHKVDRFLAFLKNKGIEISNNQDVTISQLGFDSMDHTEMLIFLKCEMGLDISLEDLEYKTVRELCNLCEVGKEIKPLKKHIHEIMRKYPELVPLSLKGDGPLTFWIHPLSGDVGVYHTLATNFDKSFRMLAIKAKGFLSVDKEPLYSVVEMAEYYCNIIEEVQHEGPYYLAGFSFGGTIAYEIVRQLEKRKKKTAKLLLIEAPFIRDEDRCLFHSSYRNNIISNANFMLSSLIEDDKNFVGSDNKQGIITNNMLADVKDNDLVKEVVKLCKSNGLLQTEETLEFKLRSISDVHKANLIAIQGYSMKKMENPASVKVCMIRTKGASAISDRERNPEYLEIIQRERGSMLPLLKGWEDVFPDLETIIVDESNHLDIFHTKESVEKIISFCKNFFVEGNEEERNKTKGIAIVGMSGRFPDASCPDELWNNIMNGLCSIKKVPDDRGYQIEDYYDSNIQTPGKTYVKKCGYLSNVDKFDPLFFKMSHREAECTDPSERIFIEEAWKAIEDAGYSPSSINGEKWGVFACAKGDYPLLLQRKNNTCYLPTNSYAATRLSYLLNLTGPAIAIDTACSSTAAAVVLACNSIQLGESEAAVVGGGGIYCTPNILIESSQSLLLSQDEICYPFDERANGTIVAEAVGALVLKPLDKAIEDKNHIYGVIKGWGLNQDGKTNGMSAPNEKAQTRLQTEIYEKFGINPEEITMIEAHGTGTKLGDAIEYQALRKTYSRFTDKESFCAIGSIKPNIGHAFFGAGIAGIIKILLSLKHKKIAPLLNHQRTSQSIDTDHSPFYFTTELKDWTVEEGKKRLAALNSFGVTGTNVHLVIEEYLKDENKASSNHERDFEIIVLSAKNEERLHEYARRLYNFFCDHESEKQRLSDIAYTLQVGRDEMEQRLAFSVETHEQVKLILSNYLNGAEDKSDFYTGYVKKRWQDESDNFRIDKIENADDARRVCQLWIEGKTIDWSLLHPECDATRVSLPTYPFEEERCWIETEKKQTCDLVKKTKELEQDNSKDLLLLEERWVLKSVDKRIKPEKTNILCFLGNKNNQERFINQLRKEYKDVKCIFVVPNNEKLEDHQELYTVEPSDQDSFYRLFDEFKKQGEHFDTILYLWPYENKKYRKDYHNIQILIQALLHTKSDAEMLWLCSPFENELERCYVESWRGFACSLGYMVSKTGISVILEEKDSELNIQNIGHILTEIITRKRNQIVIWNQNKRYVNKFSECKIPKSESVIKEHGTYLIIGGLGGLGYLFAKYLSEKYHAFLILTGRSQLTEEGKRKLDKIRALGGKATYIMADVTDKEQMQFCLKETEIELGSVRGIIHTAGVFGETLFKDKEWKEFQNTILPKIKGVQVIEEIFQNRQLDFTCYFSSLSAILGDFGYCDYSVGNAFMMSYARYMNDFEKSQNKVKRTVAINWPLWKNGGMGIESDEALLYLERSGQRYLEDEEGIQALERILTLSGSQYVILAVDSKNKKQLLLPDIVSETTNYTQDDVESYRMNERIEKDLKKIISRQFGIPVDRLERTEHLMEYGFDSINLYEFARNISEHYGINVTSSQLLGHTTIASIQELLTKEYLEEMIGFYQVMPKPVKEKKLPEELIVEKKEKKDYEGRFDPEPVAIIGISGVFPQSESIYDFWACIKEQKECIQKLSNDRKGFEGMKQNYEVYGGFLKEVDVFDPKFFGISEMEATFMDPCQRIFLEQAWNTFEDAGYGKEKIKGSACGVYVGIEEGDYDLLVSKSGQSYGNQNAVLSARIANALDLTGPNMSITASCSSGLTALHQACQAIRCRECEIALAAGIAILATDRAHMEMEEMGILSPTNRVYVYDKRADGMVPAEAAVTVLLKPLSKAVRDKDHIYGCVLGSGVNYCGQGNGMMTPNPVIESELMKMVLEKNNINPADIQFIIGHGMGTKMGDAAEVEAIKMTLGTNNDTNCYLSSVKPIVGHTFAASGLVSLVAMLMAMKDKTIFGLHNFECASEEIDFSKTNVRLTNSNISWNTEGGKPRIGAISTFGNSGSNAFAVIGEYLKKDDTPVGEEYESDYILGDKYIFIFSAQNEDQLRCIVGKNLDYLNKNKKINPKDVAYTLQTGRTSHNCRLAIISSNVEELINSLEKYLSKSSFHGDKLEDDIIFEGEKNKNNNPIYSNLSYEYKQILIEKMISNQDYESIANLWVQGIDVDWNILYSQPENKVPLPGYSFMKQHFWVTNSTIYTSNERMMNCETKMADVFNGIEDEIVEFLSDKLGIEKNKLDVSIPLTEYGVSSMLFIKLKQYIKKRVNVNISNSKLLESPTIKDIAEFCCLHNKITNDKSTNKIEMYKDKMVMKAISEYENGRVDLKQLIEEVEVGGDGDGDNRLR